MAISSSELVRFGFCTLLQRKLDCAHHMQKWLKQAQEAIAPGISALALAATAVVQHGTYEAIALVQDYIKVHNGH